MPALLALAVLVDPDALSEHTSPLTLRPSSEISFFMGFASALALSVQWPLCEA